VTKSGSWSRNGLVAAEYFNDMMIDRQLLFWTIATRRELERWEARVAEIIRLGLQSASLPGLLVWLSEAERHFVFVAARNLVRTAERDAADTFVDSSMAEDLKNIRVKDAKTPIRFAITPSVRSRTRGPIDSVRAAPEPVRTLRRHRHS
jgi:hypothetical protein